MLQVKEQINEGALIGVLADRSLGDTGSMRVNFLGSEAGFPTGPFRLAAMLQHPVYFMTGIFEGDNRYSVHLELIADFSIRLMSLELDKRNELYLCMIVDHSLRRYCW